MNAIGTNMQIKTDYVPYNLYVSHLINHQGVYEIRFVGTTGS
jgi:hypothetical protein